MRLSAQKSFDVRHGALCHQLPWWWFVSSWCDARLNQRRICRCMRRKRALLAAMAVVIGSGLLVGTATSAPKGIEGRRGSEPTTHLRFVAVNTFVGRAEFHLDCAPTGGDLPAPAQACNVLATDPRLITNPKPFTCMGGPSSWWDVTVSGRLEGKQIQRRFSTCWTSQMVTLGRLGMSWDALQQHMLPRRHESVRAGTKRTFPSGVLRPSDLVTCDIRGQHLELGVPSVIGHPWKTGYDGQNVTAVTLSLTRHADGSVTASCAVVK
jgi:hypothetical protein